MRLNRHTTGAIMSLLLAVGGCIDGTIGNSGKVFAAPADGTTVDGVVVIQLGQVPDETLSVSFMIDDEVFDEDLLPPFEAILDTSLRTDGLALVTAWAETPSGELPFGLLHLTIDNHGPDIRLTPATTRCWRSGQAVLVAADIEDAAGIAAAQLRVNTGLVVDLEGAPYTHQFDPVEIGLAPGQEIEITVAAENTRDRISDVSATIGPCAQ